MTRQCFLLIMLFFLEIFTFALGILIVFYIKNTSREIDIEKLYTISKTILCNDASQLDSSIFPQHQPAPLFDWQTLLQNFEMYQQRFQRCSTGLLFLHSASDDSNPWTLLEDVIQVKMHHFELQLDRLEQVVQSRAQRLVFLAEGKQGQNVLEFLHENPGVRDVTKCVVLLHPILTKEWLVEKFDHEQMDAESNHPIFYIMFHNQKDSKNPMVVQTPPIPSSGWQSIDVTNIDHEQSSFSLEEQRALLVLLDNLIFQ